MRKKTHALSDEQRAIVQRIDEGRNVLVTGSAGTGKSEILKTLGSRAGKPLPVCASTGIAAVQVGGLTLHSWAGLGLADKPAEQIAADILEQSGKAKARITNADRLAIDEVSMLHGELFNTLDHVFRIVRRSNEPFGGVQLILFGDFLQLPPVSRGKAQQFAFESDSWRAAKIRTGLLTKVWRQSDERFSGALNRIRVGDVAPDVASLLKSRFQVADTDPSVKPVIVYSHNADVDRENAVHLAKLLGETQEYKARDQGQAGPLATLQKNCLAPETLQLRKGAQVMLLWNVAPDEGLANGSIGTVEDFKAQGAPVIRFANGERWTAEKTEWTIKSGDDVLASRKQYPLRLAWAITAHKSQGMTLDKIQVHLHRVFEYGQAYVALSRARTLDGLFIESSKAGCIKAHPSAVEFYRTASL